MESRMFAAVRSLTAVFVVICRSCGREIEIHATAEQLDKWDAGVPIVQAMPGLPLAERDALITGTCEACLSKLIRRWSK